MDRLADELRTELVRLGPRGDMLGVLERWRGTVGEAIARHAWPARRGRDGTLHVNTADSVWAFELGQQAREIAARLGVPRVRFAPGPLPEASLPPAARPVQATPEEAALARALAAGIESENLREHVQKAISLSLARGRSAR